MFVRSQGPLPCREQIYFLDRKRKGVNGKVKSPKSIVIKAGYPNLLHGYDFLGYDLMNS